MIQEECMSKKKIRPLSNRIVVRRHDAIATKGGILLPQAAQEKPRQGEVMAVGPGKFDEKGRPVPLAVQVGARVLFASYAGTEYKSGEEDFLILSEDDILAVVV